MAVSSVGQKSTTFAELAHLTAGYSYWLTGDFRLQPENGNLPQRWAALPLLLGHYRFPSLEQEAWRAPAGSGQRQPLSTATELHGLCLRLPQQPLRGGTSARRTERSRRPTTAARSNGSPTRPTRPCILFGPMGTPAPGFTWTAAAACVTPPLWPGPTRASCRAVGRGLNCQSGRARQESARRPDAPCSPPE